MCPSATEGPTTASGKPVGLILVVDDDPDVRHVMRELLASHFVVHEAHDAATAVREFERVNPDVVLLDLALGHGPDGFWVLDQIRRRDPIAPVVILSMDQGTETVVRAMKAGAAHYIAKTPRYDELLERIRLALAERRRALQLETHRLPEEPRILGDSPAMHEVRRLAELAGKHELPVLLLGETGTGKGLVARSIHRCSRRAQNVYRDVNVAGLPSSVLDSELFGHERGAFTGAERVRRGLFELASGGTLLLDEIGDLSRDSQVKLLKVVEEQRVHRLGSDEDLTVDVRIIAATHRDIGALIAEGSFRADLYHRLAGLVIELPPLRQRKQDIALLAQAFLGPDYQIAPDAQTALESYEWPGNVRELLQVLRRAVIFSTDGVVTSQHVQLGVRPQPASPALKTDPLVPYHIAAQQVSEQFRRRYLEELLARTKGNVSQAARESGLSRTHLHQMITELGLDRASD